MLGCFKPVPETTTTAVETTPGGVTTSPGAVTGTTGEVTQTAAGTTPLETAETTRGRQTTTPVPGTTTTEQPCPLVEGMDEPQLIPEDWISTTSGEPVDTRPGDDPWTSTPEDENPEITIRLDETPEPEEYIESITLTQLDNVESYVVTLFIPTEELPSEPVFPGGVNMPNYCIYIYIYIYIYIFINRIKQGFVTKNTPANICSLL